MRGEIHIQLLGRFGIEFGGRRVGGFRCRGTQELIARLVLGRGRAHRRESLAECLWGHEAGGDPRRRLRQALWQAQTSLARSDESLKGVIQHLGPEWIQIDPAYTLVVDVESLQRAAEKVARLDRRSATAENLAEIEAALALYKGEFLEGSLSDWCILERERFNDLYVGLLERLMKLHQLRGDFRAGIEYGLRVLREDRARECTHRRLMRLYYRAGDRTGALRQYERCARALREELDVEPSRRTSELARKIRRDDADLTPAARSDARGALDAQAVLERLVELRELLNEASGQVQADIGRLTKIVHGRT